MNRRQLMMLSGAAVAAQGLVQPQTSSASQRASTKTLLKLTHAKSSYKIPKTDAKKAKYLRSLHTALALTADQQAQADAIFTNALAARAALKANIKTARKNLRDAVKSMDTAAMDRMSAAVGSLKAQLIAIGAGAHASFYRSLTSDQQGKLIPFQS
jgi:hypothetical protein